MTTYEDLSDEDKKLFRAMKHVVFSLSKSLSDFQPYVMQHFGLTNFETFRMTSRLSGFNRGNEQ